MSPNPTTQSSRAAYGALVNHPHYAYRGCAPDVAEPTQAAGDLDVPVTAWAAPDIDGGEPQKVREARERAAVTVCERCPVLAVCRTYANSLTEQGQLVEPHGVMGGQRALERHKQLIEKRHQVVPAAPKEHLLTAQKKAVLGALAQHTDPVLVAEAAGVDVRTANWQRASLTRQLGLPREVSRMGMLAAARERGVLEVTVVPDDGTVPATPPPAPAAARTAEPAPVVSIPAPRREPIPGGGLQMSLWDDEPALSTTPGPVDGRGSAERQEAAA